VKKGDTEESLPEDGRNLGKWRELPDVGGGGDKRRSPLTHGEKKHFSSHSRNKKVSIEKDKY